MILADNGNVKMTGTFREMAEDMAAALCRFEELQVLQYGKVKVKAEDVLKMLRNDQKLSDLSDDEPEQQSMEV